MRRRRQPSFSPPPPPPPPEQPYNPKFAVLGANSFSGSHFVAHALSCGHEVLQLQRPAHDLNSGLNTILSDVKAFGATHFVNFAALNMVAESWLHWEDYLRTNVLALARLNEGLRAWGRLKMYLQISTPEVYGAGAVLHSVQEGAVMNPTTPYAVSRAAADMYLGALHKGYGFPVCFTRTVNVYGPGQQLYRIIPKTVLSIMRGKKIKLHGGGLSARSFIHIRDFAAAAYLISLGGKPGEVYHIATPRLVRIRDLVEMLCRKMGVRFEEFTEDDRERRGKDMAYLLDDGKIRREMAWTHQVDLDAGLSETVKWFADRAESFALEPLEYAHKA